jgi:hypothetical protein
MRVLPMLMSLFWQQKFCKCEHVLSSLASLEDASFVVVSDKGAYAGNATVDVKVFGNKNFTNVNTSYLPWVT